jgi:hypothetical protein
MLQLGLEIVSSWLWALLPVGLPVILIVVLWRTWSYHGDFELTEREKVLRVALFVGVMLMICWILAWSTAAPRSQQVEWDEITE